MWRGVPEILENESTGLIVSPSDPLSLAQAIAKLMDGKCNWLEIRNAAYTKQSLNFSDTSMAKNVAGVYQDILG